MTIDKVSLSLARTCLSNDGQIIVDWDIDRWENDGGRTR